MNFDTGLIGYSVAKLLNASPDSLFGRFLGPSADIAGKWFANFTEEQLNNVSRVFEYAVKILGSGIESPGKVNPRIWRDVFGESAFCDDELTLYYFAGVLAASRNDYLSDNRGLSFVSMLKTMSSYQLRTHYIIYTIFRKKRIGVDINYEYRKWFSENQIYITYEEFEEAMNLKFKDKTERDVYLPHIFMGLKRLDLISYYSYANVDVIKEYYPKVNHAGFIVAPSVFGIELYMWANGHSNLPPFDFLDSNIQFVSENLIEKLPLDAEVVAYKSQE